MTTPSRQLPSGYSIHSAHWSETDPEAAYNILRLRFQVYYLEQRITEDEDLDGQELEPETLLYWVGHQSEPDGTTLPVATLRVLQKTDPKQGDRTLPGHIVIGRVATSAKHRGKGLAGALIQQVLDDHPTRDVELHAQAHLERWYAQYGFQRKGPNYPEAGIPHVPMMLRRAP